MDIKKVLDADYRTDKGVRVVDRALRQIGPLKKKEDDEDIALEEVEDVISIMCRKYQITIREIRPIYMPDTKCLYSACISTTDKSYSVLGYAYGCCLYEVMAKAAIKIYSEIKEGNVEKSSG